jgi:hypothetical protein
VTIYTPQRLQLELALDEVELNFPAGQAGGPGAAAAVEVAGSRLELADGRRAIFALSGVTDLAGLQQQVAALTAVNPTAEAVLVAYVPGVPRSSATLRLVTREIAILLEPGRDARAAIAGLPAGPPRAVAGAPSGYVADAADPFKALEVAEALRQRPGVIAAYPIVRRLVFGR